MAADKFLDVSFGHTHDRSCLWGRLRSCPRSRRTSRRLVFSRFRFLGVVHLATCFAKLAAIAWSRAVVGLFRARSATFYASSILPLASNARAKSMRYAVLPSSSSMARWPSGMAFVFVSGARIHAMQRKAWVGTKSGVSAIAFSRSILISGVVFALYPFLRSRIDAF